MMRSGSEGTTRREGRSPAAMALLANAVFVLTIGGGARGLNAQDAPGQPLIEQAALQVNSIAPPPLPDRSGRR